MAIRLVGASSVRKTDAGTLVGTFIDDNREDLSMNMIDALEKLAEEIDNTVGAELIEKQEQIESLTSEVEQLTKELEEIK